MVDFTVLIIPGAFSSSVAVTLDVMSCAATMARRVGCPVPRWRVVSTIGNVQLSNGLSVEATALPASPRADKSTWILPGLGMTTHRALDDRIMQPDAKHAIEALRRHARCGGRVAAGCSSVFLLQAAGLLKGKVVTTTWWLAPILQQLEPTCVVEADRMVVCDEPVVTAGAAFAQTDLVLQLLRMQFGPALADAVSRILLIDARRSQGQFIVPAMLAGGNELVARLAKRFEATLPNALRVRDLAAEFGISERTLSRQVRAATGRSTVALLQSVRLVKARALLETSALSIEEIAERVGYVDTSALRRLMRKVTGATPRQFRP